MRTWELPGPDEDMLSLAAVAKLFGYEVATLKDLIRDGKFPQPRGLGQNQFFAGEDVAAIRLLFGRWQPAEKPRQTGDKPRKNGDKHGESEKEDES